VNDEGFREIQLNGKQLIFLFMAVTVVSVVIFLFGVLVGRGVRDGASAPEVASAEVAPDEAHATAPVPDNAAPPASAGGSSSNAPAAPPPEELSYAERLLRDSPPEENLKPGTSAEPDAAPVVKEPVAEKAPPPQPPPPAPREKAPVPSAQAAPAPAAAVKAEASDPTCPGFAVQVAAYRDRRDADSLAKQLAAKGYPAFVMDPVKGTSTALFRVRVGKYKNLKDAESVVARLQTAEQLTNAWIAR
jgi:cell division protein FtsN